jgi:hypothetical protein
MADHTIALILGAELPDGAHERQGLRGALVALWEAQHGELQDVAADLERLAVFFSPVRSGETVRAALSVLGSSSRTDPPPPGSLVEQSSAGHLLVTPEGRVAIDLLEGGDTYALGELMGFYRRLSRHRIRQVVAVMTGAGRPAQAPAVGMLVLLLMCRSVGPRRALSRENDDGGAVARVVEAFADVIAPSKRRSKGGAPRRRGSWQLGELTRRADSVVTRTSSSIYINRGDLKRATEEAGRLLARRPKVTKERLAAALDALDAALDEESARLAQVGIDVPPSGARRRVRASVLAAFDAAR